MKTELHNKRIALVALLLLFVIVVASVVYVFFPRENRYATSETMKAYAETFTSTYNQDISQFHNSIDNFLYFYSNSSYNVTSFISSDYGTAMFMTPSENASFTNKQVQQRIEEALFGGNLSRDWPLFSIPANGTHILLIGAGSGGRVETSGNPFIELGENSSVIVENLTINSVFYPCIILKANNETNSWNTQKAQNDEKEIFEDVLVNALNNSELVREYYAQPVLTALLQNVVNKWHKSLTTNNSYTPLAMKEDIENIKEIAGTQYGIANSSDLVNYILNFVNERILPPPPPPKTVLFVQVGNDQGNWWYVFGWCFLPFFAYMFFPLFHYLHDRFHWRDMKFLYFVYGALISPFFASLITSAPYDYQFWSLQSGIIILVIVIGSLAIYETKKYIKRAR